MKIDFEKMQGLVPAIVQDSANSEILMLGFMNREAWEKTQELGYVTFYSRTRNELWTKGETSGNRLKVISAATDCDRDSILIQGAEGRRAAAQHRSERPQDRRPGRARPHHA